MAIFLNLIAGFLVGISLALHAIAIACPFWIKDGTYKFGLWKICYSGLCSTLKPISWLIAVQVFSSIGLLALITAYLTSFIRLFVKKGMVLLVITILSNLAAVVALFIGIVVFRVKAPSDKFHFSFVVEILSLVISTLSFAVNITDLLKSRNSIKDLKQDAKINIQEKSKFKYEVGNEVFEFSKE